MSGIKDKLINIPSPSIKDDAAIYVDGRSDTSSAYVNEHRGFFEEVMTALGFRFACLHDLVVKRNPYDIEDIFTELPDTYDLESIYQLIMDAAGADEKSGMLIRWHGESYFWPIPEEQEKVMLEAFYALVDFLYDARKKESQVIRDCTVYP